MVTIRQVQLALGGSPGLWGADIQIRVGDSPGQWNFAPAAVATDVGGWVAPELRTPVTGRYVQIWFTKLPRDSWGTYQEHVYGVTVHGSVPAHTASHSGRAGGGAHPAGGSHRGPAAIAEPAPRLRRRAWRRSPARGTWSLTSSAPDQAGKHGFGPIEVADADRFLRECGSCGTPGDCAVDVSPDIRGFTESGPRQRKGGP